MVKILVVISLFIITLGTVNLNAQVPDKEDNPYDNDYCFANSFVIDAQLQKPVKVDPAVKKAVNNCYETTGNVTEQQMLNLYGLVIDYTGFENNSLQGMEHAKNLGFLLIRNNTSNKALDLKPLSDMQELNTLGIGNSNAKNFISLNTTNLTNLGVTGTYLTDEMLNEIITITTIESFFVEGDSDITSLGVLQNIINLKYINAFDMTNLTKESVTELESIMASRGGYFEYNYKYMPGYEDDIIVPAVENDFCKTNEYVYNVVGETIEVDERFGTYFGENCYGEYYDGHLLTIKQLQALTFLDASIYYRDIVASGGVPMDDDVGVGYAINLETLIIDGMGNMDMSSLINNKLLSTFSANDTNVYDYSVMGPSIVNLYLSNANINNEDLAIIVTNNPSIENLVLDDNAELSDITPLYNLEGLKSISLNNINVVESEIVKLYEYFNISLPEELMEEATIVPLEATPNELVISVDDTTILVPTSNEEPVITKGVEQKPKKLQETGDNSYYEVIFIIVPFVITLAVIRNKI